MEGRLWGFLFFSLLEKDMVDLMLSTAPHHQQLCIRERMQGKFVWYSLGEMTFCLTRTMLLKRTQHFLMYPRGGSPVSLSGPFFPFCASAVKWHMSVTP